MVAVGQVMVLSSNVSSHQDTNQNIKLNKKSLPSCPEEKHPSPKSDQDLDPDKPVCSTSCWKDVTDPAFLRAFLWFLSLLSRLLQRTLES